MRVLASLSGPLRVPIFRHLWAATIISNLGTMMHGVGAAWLMTSLTTSPLLVAMVPAAVFVPAFVFGLWGGVIADLFDRRRILIVTQSAMGLSALAMALCTWAGVMSPGLVIVLTLLLGLASALNLPAWQSQVQDIVPVHEVPAAVSLNSMSFNIARAIGPALGGVFVAAGGPAPVFLLNAVSYLATVFVLASWKRERAMRVRTGLVESFVAGARYVFAAPRVRAPLVRVAVFAFGTSAVWAVLPLIARDRLDLAASGYGTLLAAFGLGSLLGGGLVPAVRKRFGAESLVTASGVVISLVIAVLAVSASYGVLLVALFFGGMAWVGALIPFNVAVQTSVPEDVRGRAMSFYLVAFQGSLAIGSVASGWIGEVVGIPHALLASAVILLAGVALRIPFPLREASGRA